MLKLDAVGSLYSCKIGYVHSESRLELQNKNFRDSQKNF